MKHLSILFTAIALLLSTLQAQAQDRKGQGANADDPISFPPCVITTPPDSLHLDPFYKKYVSVNGLPLISSWRVPDSCIQQAFKTLYAMTSMLSPDILRAMQQANARVGIMARYEGTTDIPEHRYLVNDTSINWDLRARGLGGTPEEPLTTCAEENILAYQIDKYHAEDIFVHEFAHAIHLIGIAAVDTTINTRIKTLLSNAVAEGKYQRTYAADNFEEYWAEGVQDWFNVNAEVERPDGKHNWVNTREELREYDPALYQLISEYLPATNLQISKHQNGQNLYGPDGKR